MLRLTIVLQLGSLLIMAGAARAQDLPVFVGDDASQRILPLPPRAGNVSEQVGMLEELSRLMGGRPPGASQERPPALSPQQMEMLDAAADAFRNEKGEVELPDLDAIPKSWIQQLLPDQQARNEAKRLLEEYAQKRQLTIKPGNNRKGAGGFFPPNQAPPEPDRNTLDPNQAGTNQPGTNQPRADQPSTSQPSTNRRGTNRQVPDSLGTGGAETNAPSNLEQPGAAPGAEPSSSAPQRSRREASGAVAPTPDETRNSSIRGADNRNGSSPQSSSPQGSGQGSSPPLSAPETPREIQELIDRLKQLQQQRALQQQDQQDLGQPNTSRTSPPRAGSNRRSTDASRPNQSQRPNGQANRAQPSGSQTKNQQGRTSRDQAAAPRLPPGANALPNDLEQWRSAQRNASASGAPLDFSGNADRQNDNGQNKGQDSVGQNNDRQNSDALGSLFKPGQEPPKPTAEQENPFAPGFKGSGQDPAARNNPFEDPLEANAKGERATGSNNLLADALPSKFRVRELADDLANQPSASSNSDDVGQGSAVDGRQAVQQNGLAKTLRDIVTKTLREEGFSKSNNVARSSDDKQSWLPWQRGQSRDNPDGTAINRRRNDLTAEAESLAEQAAANLRPSAARSQAPGAGTAASPQWQRWLREVWKSVSTAPPPPKSDAGFWGSRSSGNSPAANAGNLPALQWNGSMTMVVLITAALIGLVIWLSRRRLVESSSPELLQAQWARTILAGGLKSRADVIRAFHRLVAQGRPVADWWTHRHAVQQINARAPQLASVMNELASVYEHARYYPDDVPLTSQQLERVRTLLESTSRAP